MVHNKLPPVVSGEARMFGCKPCLVFSLVLIFFAGCGDADDGEKEGAENPLAGAVLKIAVPAGNDLQTSWRIELDEWAVRSDARYRITEYDAENSESELVKRLGLDAGKSGATLVVFPITQIAELALGDQLAPIPDEIQSAENLNWIDLFQGLREGPGTIAGKPMVLPLSSPVLVCYYRKDVFEREKLLPPETWQQYLTLLETLDRKGLTAVEPWDERFRASMFLARAVAYAKHPNQYSLFFDVKTGQPLIDTDGFVRALEEAGSAIDVMKQRTDVAKLSVADCRRKFFSGEAVMSIAYERWLENSPVGRAKSLTAGFVRLPGTPQAFNRSTGNWETPRDGLIGRCTLTAYSGLCAGVSGRASKQEQQAAWSLLSQLAARTNTLVRVFPGDTKSPCRLAHLSRPDAWVPDTLSNSEAGQYLDAVAESLRDTRLVAELPVAGRSRFRDMLTAGIDRFLSGELSAREALRDVAMEWQRISSDIGRQKVINSYRSSLGLRPRAD